MDQKEKQVLKGLVKKIDLNLLSVEELDLLNKLINGPSPFIEIMTFGQSFRNLNNETTVIQKPDAKPVSFPIPHFR